MTHTPRLVYLVLVAWMLVGSTIRCFWLVQHGFGIDALPVVTIVLALGAIVAAFRPLRAPEAPAPGPTRE